MIRHVVSHSMRCSPLILYVFSLCKIYIFNSIDDALFNDLLLEKPHALIQFKIFKQNPAEQMALSKNVDKRLIRVKNMNSLPIGVW